MRLTKRYPDTGRDRSSVVFGEERNWWICIAHPACVSCWGGLALDRPLKQRWQVRWFMPSRERHIPACSLGESEKILDQIAADPESFPETYLLEMML